MGVWIFFGPSRTPTCAARMLRKKEQHPRRLSSPAKKRGGGSNIVRPRSGYRCFEWESIRVVMEFTAVFRKVPEGYIGFVEELPGANTQAATLDEARRNLKEAVALVLEANRSLTSLPSPGQGEEAALRRR
jgi:predicted RNase H-like HicB family nuclease